jgi:hypothetical protein
MSYVTKSISLTEITKRIKSVGAGWKAHATREGTLRAETQAIGVQCLIQLDQDNPNYDAIGRHIKAVGAETVNGKALILWVEAFSPTYMNFEGKTFIGCKKDKSDTAVVLNIALAEDTNYWEFKVAPAAKDLAFFQDADAKLLARAQKALNAPEYATLLAGRRVNSQVVSLAA